ncbi:Cell division topological specificity factor [Buchnera aphidicola (Tetraneura ulmi)]|uniref:cell division topological specificity factor MinE n=1 Tax=Buchnera aphidicola TaxID=9 RepID=UPI003464DBED
MSVLNLFLSLKKNSAFIAKKRLQIIVSNNRKNIIFEPDYLPNLKKEILLVISKYIKINNPKIISIKYKKEKKSITPIVIKLNIIISDK